MLSSQAYLQNLQGIIYIHWDSKFGFERFDVYLGKINGEDCYWSFEPAYPKHNQVLRMTQDGLLVAKMKGGWERGQSWSYRGILESLHTKCDGLTNQDFTQYKKHIKRAHPDYRKHIDQLIHQKL